MRATPSRGPISLSASITTARCRTASPARPRFFLHLHQRLRTLRALAPLADLALLLDDLLLSRIGRRGLRPSLLRRQPLELAPVTCRTPRRQVRRVQSLPTNQRTDRARCRRAICLAQNPALVLGSEAPPLRLRDHLALRRCRLGRRRDARRNSSRPTGSFRFAGRPSPKLPLRHLHPSFPPRPLQ